MTDPNQGGYTDGIDGVEDMDAVDMLTGDDQDEPYDTSYSPPDFEPSAARHGMTAREEREGESLDQRLSEEEPDIDFSDAADDVTDPRAGRLVSPDEGLGADTDAQEIAYDAGKAGSAASAEEAAVHIVEDPESGR